MTPPNEEYFSCASWAKVASLLAETYPEPAEACEPGAPMKTFTSLFADLVFAQVSQVSKLYWDGLSSPQ